MYNKHKNRFPENLPSEWYIMQVTDFLKRMFRMNHSNVYIDESYRVRLRPTSLPGSDYINASFVNVSYLKSIQKKTVRYPFHATL